MNHSHLADPAVGHLEDSSCSPVAQAPAGCCSFLDARRLRRLGLAGHRDCRLVRRDCRCRNLDLPLWPDRTVWNVSNGSKA